MVGGHCDLNAKAFKVWFLPLQLIAWLMTGLGLGCVKTKSDLVVMPSEGRIFAFFCSERDYKPQNSGCGYTTHSFHTAWTRSCRRTLIIYQMARRAACPVAITARLRDVSIRGIYAGCRAQL